MAGTVYTESVVTLNSSQAEATLNALKSSADDLRKKMIEATKLGNTEDAAKYQKQLDSVNKSMQSIKKETKDYSDIMKRLNGSSLNELAKAYSGLNKQIKNLTPGTKEFIEKSKQLKQVKSRMDEINASVKGTNKALDSLKGMVPKIGLAAVFAAAGKALLQFAKDAVSQTQLVGDRWRQFTHGMKSAYSTFVADLVSGKGWKELIANMRESYKVGKQVEQMLDELTERQNSLSIKESEYAIEIEKAKQAMKDTTKSDEERLQAAQRVIDLERELADQRKDIASQEMEARKLELQDRTKLSDERLEAFVADYNNNRQLIQQAVEYQSEYDRLSKQCDMYLNQLANSRDGWTSSHYGKLLQEAQDALVAYEANADQAVKTWADTINQYNLANDDMVKNYVQARVKMNQAEASFYSSTTKAVTTVSNLKKDISKERAAEAEAAYKAEVDAAEKYIQELQIKAKEAYTQGELTEEQYQSRMEAIQEQGIRTRMAIAERYKKETLTYQSQLLDLTIKQQEEFKKLLEQSEADAAKAFEQIAKDAEAEIADIMAEVDADFDNWLDHFLELVNGTQDVRDFLDPKAAMNREMEQELAQLDEMYNNKLLTEEEYQKAKKRLVESYAREQMNMDLDAWMSGMDTAMSYIDQVGKAVTALQDMRMAQLDAQMQAELSAAGDNAEERERIEQEYEEKKLETQKKYAVADMVVNIAKTIAAGALAAMQAFAQLGPIAGAVMAGVMAVTTAAEVATIVAQKNAIMNTTANSSGSGSVAGARVATGYSSGGYTTESGNDYQEVGVVHANEWVAPASMVRANPIVFRRLEQARKRGGHVSGVSGFADGGMTSQPAQAPSGVTTIDPQILSQLTSVLQYIIENGIPAYVLLSQLNSKQELSQALKQMTGKR